jgi:hypothetical protein
MGNFKNYGEVVFGNRLSCNAEQIHKQIFSILGTDQFINASDLRIPNLFFTNFPYDPELDHEMHEYFGVSETELPASDAEQRDIADFLTDIKKNCLIWSI